MANYFLTIDMDITATAQIQANSVEEAIEKAKNGDYELQSLNDSEIYDERLSYLTDENFNVVENFGK